MLVQLPNKWDENRPFWWILTSKGWDLSQEILINWSIWVKFSHVCKTFGSCHISVRRSCWWGEWYTGPLPQMGRFCGRFGTILAICSWTVGLASCFWCIAAIVGSRFLWTFQRHPTLLDQGWTWRNGPESHCAWAAIWGKKMVTELWHPMALQHNYGKDGPFSSMIFLVNMVIFHDFSCNDFC